MYFPLNVRDFLDRAETVFGDRVGVVDEPEQPAGSLGELSYAGIAQLARRQAATLDALGVPAGGRVAIVSQNSARMLTSFYGVSGWGRILVPINFRLTAVEVDYILEDSQAEVVLLDPELRGLVTGISGPRRVFIFGEDDDRIWGSADTPKAWRGDESATATINYTSGTTARPRGVQLTHRNLWFNAATIGWQASVGERDVYLHTLPMFHVNGWGQVYGATGMGAKHIILRQIDGREILRRIEAHQATYFCCAPAVLAIILAAAEDWSGTVPGRGRVRLICGGAPPPTITIERIRGDLGWEFIQMYGLTESSTLLTMNRMRWEWEGLDAATQARLLSRAGAPALGTRLAISPGGEVLARTNTALQACWGNPEATAEATADNWLHTGDRGHLENGYLSIGDRKKDVIVSGGENVSSIEVEDVIMSHPAVREVAVIGIPDDKWGELVMAIVVTDGTAVAAEELVGHCRSRLAGFKCPKRIEFRHVLERTATGKLQKFKLREPYWAGRERQVH